MESLNKAKSEAKQNGGTIGILRRSPKLWSILFLVWYWGLKKNTEIIWKKALKEGLERNRLRLALLEKKGASRLIRLRSSARAIKGDGRWICQVAVKVRVALLASWFDSISDIILISNTKNSGQPKKKEKGLVESRH